MEVEFIWLVRKETYPRVSCEICEEISAVVHVTWLLRCWDNGASSMELKGWEARQRDPSLGKKALTRQLEKEQSPHALQVTPAGKASPWGRRAVAPGHVDTMERGIQHPRELRAGGDLR